MFVAFWVHNFAICTSDTGVHAQASLALRLNGLGDNTNKPHAQTELTKQVRAPSRGYLSELRRDFLATIGITYAVFRIAKSRLRAFGAFCSNYDQNPPSGYCGYLIHLFTQRVIITTQSHIFFKT